jgi:hypothetical protein
LRRPQNGLSNARVTGPAASRNACQRAGRLPGRLKAGFPREKPVRGSERVCTRLR